MRQLPVIGFNSGQYDLNVVKQFLVPYFLDSCKDRGDEKRGRQEEDEEENEGVGSFFVIKRNNAFMCLSDGSVEIPRHDQLPRSRIQLRQVSESIRMRGDERSFPVRVHGSVGEARRHRSTTERSPSSVD